MIKFYIIIFIFLFTGCSRLKMAVYWSDTILISYLNDYFDIDSVTEKNLKNQYRETLALIKKNELLQIKATLEKIKISVQKNELNEAVLLGMSDELNQIFKSIFVRFEPMSQKFLSDQVKLGFATFDSEFEEKFLNDTKESTNVKKNKEKQREFIEDWIDYTIDSLTPEQEKMLNSYLDLNSRPVEQQLKSRRWVYEKFKQIRSDEVSRVQFIRQFFTDWESLQLSEYLQARNQYQKEFRLFIVQIVSSLNQKQKDTLISNIDNQIEELQNLSAN